MKRENQTSPVSQRDHKHLFAAWILATRPKTWIASISPVLIGAAMALQVQSIQPALLTLTLLFALFIQIGTNFANDYFDFLKGADTNERKGPKRAVEQGWITPSAMLKGSLTIFGAACLLAIPLMLQAGWWSFPLAALSVLLGLLYTGGPKPLGYLGLGEILVLLFFGPVAVCGTYFLQIGSLNIPVFLASLAPGLLSCSILVINNLRDEKTDRVANKKTLIVRLGRTFGSWEYAVTIVSATSIPPLLVFCYGAPATLLSTFFVLPLALPCIKKAFTFKDPRELIPLLPKSAALLLLYTALFCSALLW